jgi:hypothetical protein
MTFTGAAAGLLIAAGFGFLLAGWLLTFPASAALNDCTLKLFLYLSTSLLDTHCQ